MKKNNLKKCLLRENLTKTEVRELIKKDFEDLIKKRDFKKEIRELIADAFDDYYSDVYQRKSTWKNVIKK